MPKRDDITSVLVIGSGPIVIGQAAEFDYSGTQACRVLREEGVRVILVNPNPATIMTDPDFADATYIEPITWQVIETIIAKEKPDAILPTLGGQTALNAAIELHNHGILEKYDVELIGANFEAINKGEDRQIFKQLVLDAGADVAASRIAHTMDECLAAAEELGYPLVVRPSFTMGGLGSGFAYDERDLRRIAGAGLHDSPTSEVLLEESILGWKEYELELMRDTADNTVVVCSIENVDPVGVHTGDSITVAPALTLTDREYQNLRDIGIDIIRAVGVDTGGCNIQFAVNPADGRVIVIEMNPRVSRSSALASKATGFPIAKIAAKLAIGYRLDEIPNDITKVTPASFEPTLDYVVVKVPRFAFEKFPAADTTLTTTMKSVGEAMAIGRNYATALQKALRSLEKRGSSFHWGDEPRSVDELIEVVEDPDRRPHHHGAAGAPQGRDGRAALRRHRHRPLVPRPDRADQRGGRVRAHGVRAGCRHPPHREGARLQRRADRAAARHRRGRDPRHPARLRPAPRLQDGRHVRGGVPRPHAVPLLELRLRDRGRAVGPRARSSSSARARTASGRASSSTTRACRPRSPSRTPGYETVMVNCNPETVSTDYDTSDRLYFEPLTLEDVLEVLHAEGASGEIYGVICQLGGQTPLGLAKGIEDAGYRILGTSPEAIDLAEERQLFSDILDAAGLIAPRHGTAIDVTGAVKVAEDIGYPILVRPSFVLGGRGMEIVYDTESLRDYFVRTAGEVIVGPGMPLLVDRFLDDAIELDVDALYDGHELYIGGVMEHLEEAGIHSGDSSCTLPPISLGRTEVDRVRDATLAIAKGVGVQGLINVQFAISAGVLYVIEANPRASRTVPFVSKALGIPLAKAAARIMAGSTIAELNDEGLLPRHRRLARSAGLAGLGQGGGAALQALPHEGRPDRRLRARPRDALHGRGHGHRPRLPARLRQEPGGRVRRHAALGHGLHLGRRQRQARRHPARAPAAGARLHPRRDRGHGGDPRPQRHRRAGREQVQRHPGVGRHEHRRPHQRRRDRHRGEHPERPVGARGRLRDPRGGRGRRQGAVHDDGRARRGRELVRRRARRATT